ncbi:uncharacterized protein BuS5_03187 [Desulfosarcina sp. BuS5]|uniref:HDIG domain-containing metalloprotein n=1 Tax=Desulfosarcina sp. BuS5 TaxID=933262 RepID=UPI000486478E|nr:HDIG domain-containing metalloprotein [Desulfosarcina sp. BuS5]WDN90216.1 uncharacterized protein BuS5_03187 [Desulfosarcina sp. BuS5]
MPKNIESPFDPVEIIKKFYDPDTKTYKILLQHGKYVAQKALEVAAGIMHLNPDLNFISEAAMLHDIGICMTNAPALGCTGKYNYLCHGYLGREMLTKIGLPKHGLVCERHIGVGIKMQDIKRQKLPLPERNMVPISLEEKIIAFADKFFSKNSMMYAKEKSVQEIKNNLLKFGEDKVAIFQSWVDCCG